ncbi:SDR family NAD(P)-dependent oxidoreductase [Desulfomicrobium sp. ZS1]|uniref:type I polyketide synthase n=1 Tax=Desulfomicrobium sp. ZS1 TaxID=2952228 RepID=UPI0020B43598|nr:type I polyketide synthase [Desulfomicrobium sp. ZS1]UTF51197.1 SDR family NAD(P)-dependent oxidoreductase [Desulfomicrobium sp. ZS1]
MNSNQNSLAIIGVGCRLPGKVNSLDDLWQLLIDGRDAVTSIPPDRFDLERFIHPDRKAPGRSCTFAAGVLEDITGFDAGFFGISRKEAENLDPQQRLVLEMTWEAFEDAGIPPSSMAGSRTAVFIGAASTDMGMCRAEDPCIMGPYSMTGTSLGIISNRVSYFFDLHGPSMTIDTACSSALVALHQACRAVLDDDLPLAVAGGVNILLTPFPFIGFSKAHMLSKDGRCKVFDSSGNGYVRAEGGGVVLIKRLEQALTDGDQIHAVIRATAVNSDGRTTGIALPNGAAQEDLLRKIYSTEGIDLARLAYMEAHGTGTAAGDPIEAASIGTVLGLSRPKDRPLYVGSVKGNLGHLETGSGMAGLLKALTILKNGTIPANLHLETPNPSIDFMGQNLCVPTAPVLLPTGDEPPLIGVNSFGFGGTNAHVVLEGINSCQTEQNTEHPVPSWPTLLLSARSHPSLAHLAGIYARRLAEDESTSVYDLAAATAMRRDHLENRMIVTAADRSSMITALTTFEQEQPIEKYTASYQIEQGDVACAKGDSVFVFSGNGCQWPGMGAALLKTNTAFSDALGEVDDYLAPLQGWSVAERIRMSTQTWELDRTEVAQPLLFAVQIGLVAALKAKGIIPRAVYGHSVGEVAAAYASGALDLKDACTVIYHRSALQGLTHGSGGMAAVNIDMQRAMTLAKAANGKIEIAAINSAGSVTLAGDLKALRAIEEEIAAEKGFCKVLPLAYPFHSRYMDGLKLPLQNALADITPRPGHTRFVSTVTGEDTEGTDLGAAYWWQNIRQPVQFLTATQTLLNNGARIFLEIGAHGVLQYYVKDAIRTSGIRACVVPTLKRNADDAVMFEAAWRRAYTSGWPMDVQHIFPRQPKRISLPTYPWDRERLWLSSTAESAGLLSGRPVHPLLGRVLGNELETYENTLDTQLYPWLAGHIIGETILFPAAGFLELCHAAGRLHAPDSDVIEIVNLDIRRPFVLSSTSPKKVRTSLEKDGLLRIASKTVLTTEDWIVHGNGRVCACDAQRPAPENIELRCRDAEALPVASLYNTARTMGLHYAPPFTPIHGAWRDGESVIVEMKLSDPLAGQNLHLAPPLVDGAFQALFILLAERLPKNNRSAFLPSWFGRSIFFAPGNVRYARASLLRISTRSIVASFILYDAQGLVLATLDDCRFRRVDLRAASERELDAYRTVFIAQPHPMARKIAAVPSPLDLKKILTPVVEDKAQLLDRKAYFDTVLALCQAATIALAHEAIKPLAKIGSFKVSDGVTMGLVTQENIPYLVFILELLASHDLARHAQGSWIVEHESGLPPSVTLWRTIIADYPAHLPEAVLIGRVGLHLRQLLSGAMLPQAILGQEQGATIEHLYANAPSIRLVNEVVATLVRECVVRCPPGRRLRILEVGAAPGGLLSTIIPVLDAGVCDYVVSEKEPSALELLKATWENQHGISFSVLDVEHPDASEFEKYDVILSGQALHAVDRIEEALQGCLSLLAPGGVLVCIERSPSSLENMIQGTDPHWWTRSSSPEEPSSRLLSCSSWVRALQLAGYADACVLHEPCNGYAPDSFILLGQRPAEVDYQPRNTPPDARTTWLLLADDSNPDEFLVRDTLAKSLDKAGADIILASTGEQFPVKNGRVNFDPENADDWRNVWASLRDRERVECVHLLGLEFQPECSAQHLLDVAMRRTCVATAMAQGWNMADHPSCRFWFINGGCQEVAGEQIRPVMSQAPLWGFGRVLQNEMPGLDTRLIDLAGGIPSKAQLDGLAQELLSPGPDQELVLIDDRRYRAKIESFDSTPARPNTPDVADAIRLMFDVPGKFDRLYWRQISRCLPGPGQIQIQTMATGLNFRDVMWAMGMLPDEALENGFSGPTMGLECSGVVSAVGEGVIDFQVGDDVVCFAPSCFSSFVTTSEAAVVQKPHGLSHEEAATIPVAFFTAFYALKHLARALPGERVLVHGAAGGVGLAAIQIANHLGLEVFATAGSDEKRDFLKLLGVKHILDSRSYRFADDIMEKTEGDGVDMVLNSLHGEAIAKGLSVLRPFGRFLELGKRDFYGDSPMFLRPFRNNISYFGIDVDQLLTARPRMARQLFSDLMDLFSKKILRPLPHRIFSRANASEAFRTMQQSRHIGKLVVTFDEHVRGVRPAPKISAELPITAKGSYLISGGLGGFGLKTAERLVERGAKHLLLLGRSGKGAPEADTVLASLRKKGATVSIIKADVSDELAMRSALDEALRNTKPLKGIIHAAAVLDDAIIMNQNPERFKQVLKAKAVGAWNLHTYSLTYDLEFFILYSSATTLMGNPGQANYVAANCALETLAGYRRSRGLPAVAIAWGPIADAGMLVRDPNALESLRTILGVTAIKATDALDLLERLHWRGVTIPAIFKIDWNKAKRLPNAASNRFENMRPGSGHEDERTSDSLLEQIKGKNRKEAVQFLSECIAEEVASILRIPSGRLALTTPVADFGMDSLMAVELGIALEERFGLETPTISLSGGASITTIAERFYETLDGTQHLDDEAHILQTMQVQHGTIIPQNVTSSLKDESRAKETSHD